MARCKASPWSLGLVIIGIMHLAFSRNGGFHRAPAPRPEGAEADALGHGEGMTKVQNGREGEW
jgi:hypothetical protein